MAGDLGSKAMFHVRDRLSNVRWVGLEMDGSTGWTQTSTYDPGQKAIFATPSGTDTNDLRDLWIVNCYVHDTPATVLGIDSCINDWYLYNRIENAGTYGETQGSNGIGVGVGEVDGSAPTYAIGNTIVNTAEYGIIFEQTGDNVNMTKGVVASNVVSGARIGIGAELVDSLACGFNVVVASEGRMDHALYFGAINGTNEAKYVIVVGNTCRGGTNSEQTIFESRAKNCIAAGNVITPGQFTNNGNVCVVNGLGKTAGEVSGRSDLYTWQFAVPTTVRNYDNRTLWKIDTTMSAKQISEGDPQNLSGVTESFDGHVLIDDGTNTPSGFKEPCRWDATNSVWRPKSDPTASFS